MAVMGSEIQFKSYEQDQGDLFPAHLAETLDPSDPVFFISDLVEGLDLEIFERHYAEMGETVPRPSGPQQNIR
jgi:transposase